MTDQAPPEDVPPISEKKKVVESISTAPAPQSQQETGPSATTAEEVKTPNTLTKEEQMALFEKELKENDWGHQPC